MKNYNVVDFGTNSDKSVDYPDYAHQLAAKVDDGELQFGVVICGSGNGVAITANKYRNVRAALCWKEEISVLARKHNDANVLSLPARFISIQKAKKIVSAFLATDFEGGRHQARVQKISSRLTEKEEEKSKWV